MQAYLWVTAGAIAGANSRYFLSRFVAKVTNANFPWGTLLINVLGSLVLGFFLIWTTERVLADPRWRIAVAVGFCGSFTTFSSYAFESYALFEQGHWHLLAANVLLNNLLCLAAVLAGAIAARWI